MLIPNIVEQQVIELMRQLRGAGCTLREIAARLTIRNISTKEGATPWTHTAVGRILNRQPIAHAA